MPLQQLLRRVTAACLLALLGGLGTGLPSHDHEPAHEQELDTHLPAFDHHSHGTQLVEQDARVQAHAAQLARVPITILELAHSVTRVPATDTGAIPRPNERAPPPGSPRAPPFPA